MATSQRKKHPWKKSWDRAEHRGSLRQRKRIRSCVICGRDFPWSTTEEDTRSIFPSSHLPAACSVCPSCWDTDDLDDSQVFDGLFTGDICNDD